MAHLTIVFGNQYKAIQDQLLLEAYQPLLVPWQNQQMVVMSNLDYHIELVGKQYPKQLA